MRTQGTILVDNPQGEPNAPAQPYVPLVPPKPNDIQGQDDAEKEGVKEHVKSEQKLDDLAFKSNNTLCHIFAVFPFDFFPNEIIVDLTKISIVENSFLTRRIHSIFLKDIADVFVDGGILFASLNIVDLGFTENVLMINYLDKADAHQARRIIQSLVISAKQDIDLSKIDLSHLQSRLEELGEVKLVE